MLVMLVVAAVVAGFLYASDRKDKRHADQIHADRDAHRAQLEAVLAGHRQEIAALCQRIQAPEYAVVEHAQQNTTPNVPATNPMLDADYWQAEEERMQAIAEIERLEREGFDLSTVR